MTNARPAPADLVAVPRSERRSALEDLVVAEFRDVLVLAETAEVPRQMAFFDLGMTSLRITDVRQRLTRRLGRSVETEAFFEHSTLELFIEYLADTVLADLFPACATFAEEPEPPPMLDDLLNQLYR